MNVNKHARKGRLPARLVAPALRLAIAGTLAESGYVHARLYVDGYRHVHGVGVLFLLQASVSFAIAALLLVPADPLLQIAAAGTAAATLLAFVVSRTVGLFGFTGRGLSPAPLALISVLAESGTILLLAAATARTARHRRRRPGTPPPPRAPATPEPTFPAPEPALPAAARAALPRRHPDPTRKRIPSTHRPHEHALR